MGACGGAGRGARECTDRAGRSGGHRGSRPVGIGRAREGAGALDEALEDYRAAVALEPNDTRYRRRLADRLWQSEQYFQAINEWQIVKSQAPDDVDSRLALARALEKVGQPADAYREYREVLARAPGQVEAARAVTRLERRRH